MPCEITRRACEVTRRARAAGARDVNAGARLAGRARATREITRRACACGICFAFDLFWREIKQKSAAVRVRTAALFFSPIQGRKKLL